jgi:quercetin dioxygenase-like cupin family protein
MNRSKLIVVAGAALALASLAFAAEQKTQESKTSGAEADAKHVLLTPADLQWGEAPPGLPAGAKLAVLEGDPTKKGPFTIRLQMPDGYKIMPHTHPTAEKVTIISGIGFLGMGGKFDEAGAKQMEPGAFAIMPAGMQHFAFAKGETIVQISGKGPFEIKYVNPADDPRQTKQ